MIDRSHGLSISRQAKVLNISRGSVYYEPRRVSAEDLAIKRFSRQHTYSPNALATIKAIPYRVDVICRDGGSRSQHLRHRAVGNRRADQWAAHCPLTITGSCDQSLLVSAHCRGMARVGWRLFARVPWPNSGRPRRRRRRRSLRRAAPRGHRARPIRADGFHEKTGRSPRRAE